MSTKHVWGEGGFDLLNLKIIPDLLGSTTVEPTPVILRTM